MTRFLACAAMAFLCAGCATTSSNIQPAYVSGQLYQNLSCEQLAQEATRVSQAAVVATGKQDKKADRDVAMVGVGVVLFWPALFLMQGDGQDAAEVARLKGEMQAIEQANHANNCGLMLQPVS